MDKFFRAFGSQLRELRMEAGLTQEALAARAGLHPTFISRLEGGKVNISLKALLRICRALKVSPAGLFERFDRIP